MSEIWLPIRGYEGLYAVSNLGHVKSLRRNIVLKLMDSGNGYFKVSLSKCGKVQQFWVHRLVADAFVPNPDSLPVVDHLDGNKRNNDAENLDWCTSGDNSRRAWSNGLLKQAPIKHGEQHPNHVLTSAEVIEIRQLYETRMYSQRMLGARFGVSQATIKQIVKNRAWRE